MLRKLFFLIRFHDPWEGRIPVPQNNFQGRPQALGGRPFLSPRSAQKPGSSSCHLYDERRPDCMQASSGLSCRSPSTPILTPPPIFRHRINGSLVLISLIHLKSLTKRLIPPKLFVRRKMSMQFRQCATIIVNIDATIHPNRTSHGNHSSIYGLIPSPTESKITIYY